MGAVQKSCALKSWECFCSSDLLDSCLTQCTDDDKGRARAWQTEACGSSPSDASKSGSTPVTKTVAAKVTVLTMGGAVVTSTIQPAQTAVVNTNSAANQNSININTGATGSAAGRNYRCVYPLLHEQDFANSDIDLLV